jgi:hypothetical protein
VTVLGDFAEENYAYKLKKQEITHDEALMPCIDPMPAPRTGYPPVLEEHVFPTVSAQLFQPQCLHGFDSAGSQGRHSAGDHGSKQETTGHREKHAGV